MKTNFRLVTIMMVMLAFLFLVANVKAEVRTYDSDDVPQTIPDPGTIYSSLTVPDAGKIDDVDVVITITHQYNADLDVYLISPDGTEVKLFTDVGDFSANFVNTILDDEADLAIDGPYGRKPFAPFTGRYQPEGKLSDFDGQGIQGEWKLKVKDDDDALIGTLQSWSLTIEFTPPAEYLWNGSAGDSLWDTPANWTVTESIWTWPNEEFSDKKINSDTWAIDILNGDSVIRASQLAIQGPADGYPTAVLTLDNASSLTLMGRLAIGGVDGSKGQIDILGGSTVTIFGEGEDLKVTDNDDTWGALNIVDSNVYIADDLDIDQGEGYINISGSSTITADDLIVANTAAAVGYLDISGTTTVTIVDDIDVDEGTATITIGGDAVISTGDDVYVADQAGSVCTMTLTGNSVLNVGDDLKVGDDEGSVGHLIVSGNAMIVDVDDFETNAGEGHITITDNASVSFSPDGDLELANEPNGVGTMDISGTATVNIDDDIDLGKKGVGTLNISGDATLNVPDELYIGDDEGSEGHMNISGNAMVTVVDDIDVGDNGPGTLDISENATLHVVDSIKIAENGGEGHVTIRGNATVNNDDDIEPGVEGLGTCDISENATVNVGDDFELGVDPGSEGHLTISGNASVTCQRIFVGKNLESITSLTMNGGQIIAAGEGLKLGNSGGADIGQSRVFMNDGLLQAEALEFVITDSQIIYTGGEFRIASASLDEAGMQQLITDGKIVADVAYSIVTDGSYTVLKPEEPPMP